MKLFIVYLRSMTTYDDHQLQNLQSDNPLRIFNALAFFNKVNDAEKYILKNGTTITKNFEKSYKEGCALCIIDQTNFNLVFDDLEDYLNIVNIDFCNKPYPTYVFSEKSYKMVMNEHLIFVSHDWMNPIPKWIKYIKTNGSIVIGCDKKHLLKVLKDFDEDSKSTYIEEYNRII